MMSCPYVYKVPSNIDSLLKKQKIGKYIPCVSFVALSILVCFSFRFGFDVVIRDFIALDHRIFRSTI